MPGCPAISERGLLLGSQGAVLSHRVWTQGVCPVPARDVVVGAQYQLAVQLPSWEEGLASWWLEPLRSILTRYLEYLNTLGNCLERSIALGLELPLEGQVLLLELRIIAQLDKIWLISVLERLQRYLALLLSCSHDTQLLVEVGLLLGEVLVRGAVQFRYDLIRPLILPILLKLLVERRFLVYFWETG